MRTLPIFLFFKSTIQKFEPGRKYLLNIIGFEKSF